MESTSYSSTNIRVQRAFRTKSARPGIKRQILTQKDEEYKSFTIPSNGDNDSELWQNHLLKLLDKLADIESSRTHAIYNANSGNYYKYFQFKQIDKFDLLPDANDIINAFDKRTSDNDAIDLDDIQQDKYNEKFSSKESTKNGLFTNLESEKYKHKFDHKGKSSDYRFHGGDSRIDCKFKLLNADVRLVKSILVAHNFAQTEGHDWNILWTNSNGKPYLYTDLNEFQKVNHFPSSYEITRK